MTSTTALRRPAVALAAALIALTAAGCGSSGGGGAPGATAKAAPSRTPGGLRLPSGLPSTLPSGLPTAVPTSIDALKGYKWNDWAHWAETQIFNNPRIASLWSPRRMTGARPRDEVRTAAAPDAAAPANDPPPQRVEAVRADPPYTRLADEGKLFFDTPDGSMVCSGTVVADPAHPGKSNLVWTAGHCVHGGAGKGWYRNIAFVPAYNNNGQAVGGAPLDSQVAPDGVWWAHWAQTSPQWIKGGGETGNAASHYDYAILKVVPPPGTSTSLEQAVGGAVPVWFGAPQAKTATAWGYPAAAPYNGQFMYHCTGATRRLSLDPAAPNMQMIGCSMTGGSSGGGWFAKQPDGTVALVGNNSISPTTHQWMASPQLGAQARASFDAISRTG